MENVDDAFMYDIALIKLNQTIKAGTGKSICLPESRTALDPNLNEYGMIAGWGGSSNEILRLGYLKLNYERYKVSQFEFIYTKKLDDIRICEVSFSDSSFIRMNQGQVLSRVILGPPFGNITGEGLL